MLWLVGLGLAGVAQTSPEETELRALLKAPVVKETGLYQAPESSRRLRELLQRHPQLADRPIHGLRGGGASTPLVEAVRLGNVSATEVLLEAKARPDLALGQGANRPLHLALTAMLPGQVRLAMVRRLVAAGASANRALHSWAACTNWTDRTTYFAAADTLIQAKSGLNTADEAGASPLQVAIVHDNVLAVEKLLALGANVDAGAKDSAIAGRSTPEGAKIMKLLKLGPP